MDISSFKEQASLCDSLMKKSEEYAEKRKEAIKYKLEFESYLTLNLPYLRDKKKNAGYEILSLMMCEEDFKIDNQVTLKASSLQSLRDKGLEAESHYKGLEKVIESIKTTLSYYQSLMKYEHDNT